MHGDTRWLIETNTPNIKPNKPHFPCDNNQVNHLMGSILPRTRGKTVSSGPVKRISRWEPNISMGMMFHREGATMEKGLLLGPTRSGMSNWMRLVQATTTPAQRLEEMSCDGNMMPRV
uniref:Uncharacterized protein n=1 Tax=Micrurus surinamensis TaxID=129470 RepID=A0A2D4PM43_MICSU